RHWIEFYNQVESEMRMIGLLYDFKDYASKMAENMARLAALLHYFSGDGGDISVTAVKAAVEIVAWYIEEYIRLFSKKEEFSLDVSEADELY
ncbi:YfjI family protein, partial [Escherichia coli]|nr:YfjI family protein [Escherichia coli]